MAQILIVDDEESIRHTLAEFLRAEGHGVAEVENASAALEELSRAEFDVVVTDIILPQVSGVELLRQIRAGSSRAQVVIMTGEPTVETAREALRSGAADYLFKPISKAAILHVVANAIKLKALDDDKRRLEAENQAYRENLERLVEERTAQLRASEERAVESEERFRSLYENTLMGLYRTTPDGRILLVNPALVRMLGYRSAEEVMTRDLEAEGFEPGYPREKFKEALERDGLVRGIESAWKRADGTTVIIRESARVVRNEEGEALFYDGVVEDITERKRAEDALRKLALATEQSPVSIVITDYSGNIEFVNPKFTQVSGYTSAEVLGKNPRFLKSGETPEKDYRRLWETITAGKEWRGEFHNKRKDGALFWETVSISPIRNEAGKITHFVAVKEDVTERKRLEAQFLRAQRMEGVGALASGIAHDLNNILSPVLMTSSLLRETIKDPESREMLGTVEKCARRGAEIIRQLLTFARGTPSVRVSLPIRHLLREVGQIVSETFPRDILPSVVSPRNLWPLLGDATQLHQALMNLCVNARDAMPEGGTLTLQAKNVMVDEAFAAANPDARPGPYVCVSVSDTGTGIAPEHREQIFDPFFTTKEIGRGTGLGLATVLGIVRGHEGFLQVETEVGRGTTFKLYFPATPQAAPAQAAPPQAAPPRAQGETILVVDDEAPLRDSLRRTLEAGGYRVITAAQGADGLATFSRHRSEVRAVLTDMMMPVMNGPAMITALRAINPQLPILGMSGLSERGGVKGLDKVDLPVMLDKPFAGADLLRALHEVLHPPGAEQKAP